MPMSEVQGHGQPQPLGAFCKARSYPERYWGASVYDMLTITASGLVFGVMITPDPTDESQEAASDLSDDAYDEAYDDYELYPVGLRLARCAV